MSTSGDLGSECFLVFVLRNWGVGLIRLLNICVGEEDFLLNHLRASLNLPAHGVFGDSVQVLKTNMWLSEIDPKQ